MTHTYRRSGVCIIDFLTFVETHCCKKYLLALDTYSLQNDVTNKDVQKLFYHVMIECVVEYYSKTKSLDIKVFYVDKSKLTKCCLAGDNDTKVFLPFFIKFIKDLKNKLNIPVVCNSHTFQEYTRVIDTDVGLVEDFNKSIKKKAVSSEKVYKFLEKCGLKKLSEIYKTDVRVKFWLK